MQVVWIGLVLVPKMFHIRDCDRQELDAVREKTSKFFLDRVVDSTRERSAEGTHELVIDELATQLAIQDVTRFGWGPLTYLRRVVQRCDNVIVDHNEPGRHGECIWWSYRRNGLRTFGHFRSEAQPRSNRGRGPSRRDGTCVVLALS